MLGGIPFMTPHIGRQENGEGSLTIVRGISFMTLQGSTILHGCTIMKAESVRWEGARQEGLAAPLRTITKNHR